MEEAGVTPPPQPVSPPGLRPAPRLPQGDYSKDDFIQGALDFLKPKTATSKKNVSSLLEALTAKSELTAAKPLYDYAEQLDAEKAFFDQAPPPPPPPPPPPADTPSSASAPSTLPPPPPLSPSSPQKADEEHGAKNNVIEWTVEKESVEDQMAAASNNFAAPEVFEEEEPEQPTESETNFFNPVFQNPPEWSPGTGTGRELLLQAFNWESSRDGRYYQDIMSKAEEIAELGFTQVGFTHPPSVCSSSADARWMATLTVLVSIGLTHLTPAVRALLDSGCEGSGPRAGTPSLSLARVLCLCARALTEQLTLTSTPTHTPPSMLQVWLPPPTDSVSDEGYMPRDLYNLNSKYGSFEELKQAIKTLHDHNLSVLGDAVLNHRCAEFQGPNGVWNQFGGKLDWDQRAIVGDDPTFQGRGNGSSGESFGAAPNIDHSQDFVKEDLTEWMRWLRHEVRAEESPLALTPAASGLELSTASVACLTCCRCSILVEDRHIDSCCCGSCTGGLRRMAAGLCAWVLGWPREGVHGRHGPAVRRGRVLGLSQVCQRQPGV
jgi:hypothetical protein